MIGRGAERCYRRDDRAVPRCHAAGRLSIELTGLTDWLDATALLALPEPLSTP